MSTNTKMLSSNRKRSPQRQRNALTKTFPKPILRSGSPPKSSKGIIGNPNEHLTRLFATQSFIKEVKATYKNKPEVYQKFAFLLNDLKDPSKNSVEIIQEIVNLFEGYPNLILGLNGFLPYNCELRIQPDAVVIKIHDGHTRTEAVVKKATNKAGQAVDYINNVKFTLGESSKSFKDFLKVLQEYNNKERGNKATVKKVVKLLKEHQELIEGFNAFLPDGFSIEINEEDRICTVKNKTGEISRIPLCSADT